MSFTLHVLLQETAPSKVTRGTSDVGGAPVDEDKDEKEALSSAGSSGGSGTGGPGFASRSLPGPWGGAVVQRVAQKGLQLRNATRL